MAKHQNPRQKPKKRKNIACLDLEATARRMYLEEGGEELDETIETQQYTQQAYRSQMAAYKRLAEQGVVWDGEGLPPGAWGPVVTPKEARQTGDLVRKLLKEKEAWLERCRKKVQETMDEQELKLKYGDGIFQPGGWDQIDESGNGEHTDGEGDDKDDVIHAPPPDDHR